MANKVILTGNIGQDPEIKKVGEKAIATFTLATSEFHKDKNGERKTETQWHNIKIWSPLAEISEKWLKKGSKIYVEGKIVYESWDDKDGIKHYKTSILVDKLEMLGNKSDSTSSAPATESKTDGFEAQQSDPSDDLPF